MYSETGFYVASCYIQGRSKSLDDPPDDLDFEFKVMELVNEIKSLDPTKEPYLELLYYNEGYAEILFKFKIHFTEFGEKLERYLEEIKATIEEHLDIDVEEFIVEEIKPKK